METSVLITFAKRGVSLDVTAVDNDFSSKSQPGIRMSLLPMLQGYTRKVRIQPDISKARL